MITWTPATEATADSHPPGCYWARATGREAAPFIVEVHATRYADAVDVFAYGDDRLAADDIEIGPRIEPPREAPEPAVERAIRLLAAELDLTPPGASGTPTVRLELNRWTRTSHGGEIGAVVMIVGAPAPATARHRIFQELLLGRALLPAMPQEAEALEAIACAVLRQRGLR